MEISTEPVGSYTVLSYCSSYSCWHCSGIFCLLALWWSLSTFLKLLILETIIIKELFVSSTDGNLQYFSPLADNDFSQSEVVRGIIPPTWLVVKVWWWEQWKAKPFSILYNILFYLWNTERFFYLLNMLLGLLPYSISFLQ